MFFSIKNIDEIAMTHFWSWFSDNEFWIIDNVNSDNSTVVFDEINEKLPPIFPYFKKEIKLNLDVKNGQGKLFFFALNNRYLNRDASILKASMPYNLMKRWEFIIMNS